MKLSSKKLITGSCPIKVLLAEGNESKQVEQLEILKSLGCQVDIADSGLLALDMYGRGYDVVIAGSDLKNIDGPQLIKILFEHGVDSNVALITSASFAKVLKQINFTNRSLDLTIH